MPQLLWFAIAFLAGVLVEWLLEIFFFRRRMSELIAGERTRHDQVVREWSAKTATLQVTVNERDRELESLRSASSTLQADLATCAMARAGLLEENTSLSARAAQLESDLDAALKSKTALEADLHARDAELTQLRTDEDAHVVHNKRITADVSKLTAGAVTAAATIKELGGDKERLSAEVKHLQDQLGTANLHLQESLAAKTDTERQLAKLKAQFDQTRADLTVSNQAKVEVEKKLADVQATLERTRGDLNVSLDATASTEQQMAELKNQLDKTNADANASLQARTRLEADVRSREAELAKVRSELERHATQTRTVSTDLTRIKADATAAAATIQALEGDKASLVAELADLKARLAKADSDLDVATRAQATADRHVIELQAQLDRAEAEVKAHDVELAQRHAAIDSHAANPNTASDVTQLTAGAATAATMQALERDRAEHEARMGQLEKELSACTTARAALEAELKTRDAEIEQRRALGERGRGLDLGAQANTVTAPTPAGAAAPVPSIPSAEGQFGALLSRRADDETPFETACPQHLSDVKGIGTVFETRLFDAGIGTYWELSRLSDDQLKGILKMSELQSSRADFPAIRADARRLAQESKSLGRKWLRRAPDDLEPLQGIGHTFEKRLYDAGICTYETLASATVELLEEICMAPAQFKPDYASWIEQAKVLAAKKAKPQDRG